MGTALICMLMLSCTRVGWMMAPAMTIGGISMTSYTALSSYLRELVSARVIGEALGLAATMIDLSEIGGPIAFGALMRYGRSLSNTLDCIWFINLPFWVGTLFVLAAIVLQITMQQSKPSQSHAQAA